MSRARRWMTWELVGLVVAVLGILPLAAHAQDQPAAEDEVLAPGEPALTRSGLERFIGLFEWLVDVPLTGEQRALMERSLREAWAQGDTEEIAGYVDALGLETMVSAMKPEERALVREQALPEMLNDLRSKPDDEGSSWLLAVYEAGHQPIAEGSPPLTRQMTDAFVELTCFMLSEAGGASLEAPPELKGEIAGFLAAGYPELSAEEQAEFARMPLVWAAFRVAWPDLPEVEKAAYREQFTLAFGPQLDGIRQAASAVHEAELQAASETQTGAPSLLETQALLSAQNQYSKMMSNVLQMQFDTGRVIAANIGGNYSYQYRY